jgi:YegS/Rv2252/BmrU family lipid kinase
MDIAHPVVIVNPKSGGGLSTRAWGKLVAPLTEGLGPFDVRFTEAAGDGRRIAREESTAGRRLLVAFGGDGTISEVADGLLEQRSEAALGIIHRGTGGDFRRALELPSDLAEAGRRIREGALRRIDAGLVTFTGNDGSAVRRHFVNVASFGFSSTVAARANQASKRLGARMAFLGATLKTLVSYDNAEVLISADGGPRQRMTVLLGAVGNGRFFGGGMKICPNARLDDQKLDLVTVGDLSRLHVLRKISGIYAGTHLSYPEVEARSLHTIEVWPADPAAKIPVELDGETPGHLPAKFEVVPGALQLKM